MIEQGQKPLLWKWGSLQGGEGELQFQYTPTTSKKFISRTTNKRSRTKSRSEINGGENEFPYQEKKREGLQKICKDKWMSINSIQTESRARIKKRGNERSKLWTRFRWWVWILFPVASFGFIFEDSPCSKTFAVFVGASDLMKKCKIRRREPRDF